MSSPVLSARNLSKAYGARPLFAGLSLTINEGECVGLLGANGTGKSSLLRVLAGEEPADDGVIDRRRGGRIGFLSQEPRLDTTLTPKAIVLRALADWDTAHGRFAEVTRQLETTSSPGLLEEQSQLAESIERLGGWHRAHEADEILMHLGIAHLDRPVGTQSGGEQRRVALAALLVEAPDLALLDEPTNHLDVDTIEWLEEYLGTQFRGAVLLVTHDRYVLDALADRIVELDCGTLRSFEGNYQDYLEQKAELLAHGERVEANRLNLLRREQAWLDRGARARTTKQKARIQRAEALLEIEAPTAAKRVAMAGFDGGGVGKSVLDFFDVGIEIAGKKLVQGFTLHLVSGERIGIVGPNGAGKTSLLRVAAGELEPTAGRVVRGANTRLVLLDQARGGLVDSWTVLDNVVGREGADRTGGGMVTLGDRTMEMRTYLEAFLFDGSRLRQPVGALSGGERSRVVLAKALKDGPNLLLLDEPTNDLDVATLGALEELLSGWPGCVLVVSHDRFFLDRLATSVLAFETGGKVQRTRGGYAEYLEERRAAPPLEAPRRGSQPVASVVVAREGMKPLTYAERLELDALFERMAEVEDRVRTVAAKLSDPTLYAKAEEARELAQVHAEVLAEEVALMARWEELEKRREATRG